MAGGLVEFEQRQPLAHRHHIVVGDRIGLHLHIKGVGQRGVAARHRPRNPHHLLGWAGLALPRGGRGGALGAAGKPQPVHFADHRISRHISEFRGDLAGRKAGLPKFFQLLDAIVGPGQYRHRILPFASRRPTWGSAGDANRLKYPCGQNPLALAGRKKRARTFTQNTGTSEDQIRRTRCRTRQLRRYNMAGLWRKSPRRGVHMFRHLSIAIGLFHRPGMLRIAFFLHCRKARLVAC